MKKPISSHHRKNLELMHQTYLHTAVMFAGAGFTALVIGGIAFVQEPIRIAAWVILLFAGLIGMTFLVAAFFNLRNAEKVLETLGVNETVMKYLKPKKKASAKS